MGGDFNEGALSRLNDKEAVFHGNTDLFSRPEAQDFQAGPARRPA